MIEFSNDTRYLNNSREYREVYDDSLIDASPEIKVIRNGYILPKSEIYLCKGGVVDSDREYVKESGIDNEGSFICIDGSYDFDEYVEGECDKVIYLGYYFRHWGHFLMDCTTRMWILLDEEYSGYKVVYPNHPGYVCDGNYTRFLELIGLDESRIIRIDKPTRFDTIIVPAEARYERTRQHMRCWYDIFDKVVSNASFNPDNVPKKVYFSRGQFGKPEYGEEEVEANFADNGYERVYPERLTLDEQIGIFQCAEEVISQNSSICMNVVFARKGLKWTVINKYTAVHDNFSELRYDKELDITYVDAFDNRLNVYGDVIGTRPYLVSFNDNLKRYFDDRGMTYRLYGRGYRIGNIVRYLVACVTIVFKNKIMKRAEKTVRFMKKNTPGLFRIIKKIVG